MTTLDLQIEASSEDANQDGTGAMNLTNVNVPVDASGDWGGLRFTDSPPQGATIEVASLSLYLHTASNDSPHIDVYAEDSDSARSRTTAFADVDADDVGVGWYDIDVASVVQELVDRATWGSGNPIACLIDGVTSTNLRFRAYDFDTSLAAKLHIEYTAAGAEMSRRIKPIRSVQIPIGHLQL